MMRRSRATLALQMVQERREASSNAHTSTPIRLQGQRAKRVCVSARGAIVRRLRPWLTGVIRLQSAAALDTALAFWDLLMPHSPTFEGSAAGGTFTQHQLDLWKRFLTETTNGRAVSKDTWSLFLDFTRDIDPTFESHDFDAAWPSLIDGFVTWAKAQTAQASAMDES